MAINMDPNSKVGQVLEQGQSVVKQTVKQSADDVIASTRDQLISPKGEEDQNKKEFVEELYAPSDEGVDVRQQEIEARDNARIEEIRRELHDNYYQSINTHPQTEERAKERVDRLEHEELRAIQDGESDKPLPLDVARKAQHVEKVTGIGG